MYYLLNIFLSFVGGIIYFVKEVAFWEHFGSFFVNCFSNNTSLNAYGKEILEII